MSTAVTTLCWETCFQNTTTTSQRDLFDDLLRLTYDLKKERNINGANALAFLLDSTLAPACLSSSGSLEATEPKNKYLNTTAIWTMQLQLMAILASTVGSVRTFPVQFNENAAWACQEFSCLTECQVIKLVKGSNLSPLQTNVSACQDGLLEPACRLAYNEIANNACPSGTTLVNNMTVAILNSNAHSHVHKEGHYADYSPCHTFFDYRLAIGVSNANRDDMKRFQSERGYHTYLSDDDTSRYLIDKLFNCISSSCCTGTVTMPTPIANCKIATGHTGENFLTLTPQAPLVV